VSKDTKPSDAGKSGSWAPRELISEVKSFANKEGKQMVSLVRSAIRTVVNPDSDQPTEKPAEPQAAVGDWTLPEQSVEMLIAASEASGMPPGKLLEECVSRSLSDVVHDAEARRCAARAKLENLKNQAGH